MKAKEVKRNSVLLPTTVPPGIPIQGGNEKGSSEGSVSLEGEDDKMSTGTPKLVKKSVSIPFKGYGQARNSMKNK